MVEFSQQPQHPVQATRDAQQAGAPTVAANGEHLHQRGEDVVQMGPDPFGRRWQGNFPSSRTHWGPYAEPMDYVEDFGGSICASTSSSMIGSNARRRAISISAAR